MNDSKPKQFLVTSKTRLELAELLYDKNSEIIEQGLEIIKLKKQLEEMERLEALLDLNQIEY